VPGESDVLPLRDQLQAAELDIDRLRRQLETEKALMMGLEKLLEEKDAAMQETSQEMDRLKINMDVLLSKIADQRDELQEMQAENRALAKELAARNEEAADLREEVMRQPVQE
jgi:chromosome segregation ATPase